MKNDIISKEVTLKIQQYYRLIQLGSPNRLFAVFEMLGSILVGLGIILTLAHNWDEFSRTTKTIFAFSPLVMGKLKKRHNEMT